MDDKVVRQRIVEALDWDPSVDSANVGVAVNDGVAVLTGHLPNYSERLTAERIVKGVKGVNAVANEIEVRYAASHAITDEDIAARAAQILHWNVILAGDAVKVAVSKGWVTLTGEVDWDYQRRVAAADVRNLSGVTGLTNMITLKVRVSPADVSRRIEDALKRDAALEAARVHVSVANGTVTLEGNVHSWHERDAAERAAWAAPGVRKVQDHVRIV